MPTSGTALMNQNPPSPALSLNALVGSSKIVPHSRQRTWPVRFLPLVKTSSIARLWVHGLVRHEIVPSASEARCCLSIGPPARYAVSPLSRSRCDRAQTLSVLVFRSAHQQIRRASSRRLQSKNPVPSTSCWDPTSGTPDRFELSSRLPETLDHMTGPGKAPRALLADTAFLVGVRSRLNQCQSDQ
jgi:hypothetical protein